LAARWARRVAGARALDPRARAGPARARGGAAGDRDPRDAAEDAERQDHAAPAQSAGARPARGRHLDPRGERGVSAASREHFVHLLRQMLRIRRLEEKSAELYTQGKISGFLHLYVGEEAVAVGAI